MRTFPSRFAPPSRGLLLAAAVLAAHPAAAAVDDFTLAVPRRTPPLFQISQILVSVQVDTEAAINFTVTPPTGGAQQTGNLTPGPAPASVNLLFGADLLQVTPPDTTGLGAGDPRRRNYRFVLTPTSDFNASCQTAMAGDETWTIAVTGGATRINAACAVSFDENKAGNECNGDFRLVPNSEDFAELGGISSQEQICRFGLDAMLVLDRSGSMSARARPAEPAGPANQRIVSLRQAVDGFLNTLTAVRATEAANFELVPSDNVGVVIFNQNAADLAGLGAGLNPFNPGNVTTISTGLAGTAPSGSTSIGDGVFSADAHLGAGGGDRRRVILLMSDGQQNTDRFLGAQVSTGRVFTHAPGVVCPAGPGCNDLANLGTYQIYTVTTGLGVGPAAEQLNQDVALATGGFYLNSEDDAGELTAFFTGLLQNFLETSTWQTVLSGNDNATPGTPFTARVPITSTTQAVTATLTPRVSGRGFCMRVTPPGGPPRPEVCGTGVLTASVTPADVSRDLGGEWEIEVEARVTPQDFHLLVLADDMGVSARIVTSSATYVPGDPVRVEAIVRELGQPLTGLAASGLQVALASPTTTIGELLATSAAGTSPPAPDDGAIDDANAKAHNEAESNPAALDETTRSLSLRDDGAGGDRTAGDGVYGAEFTLEQYGNVDLVVTVRGTSERGGDFLRQKNETVHLRAVPDGGETQVTTQVITSPDGSSLVVQVVPRTRFGHRVGPGWGNYLWFTTPDGRRIKPQDNLDGSYTARISFSGATPPEVDLHVITDSVVITDDARPDDLPLDDDTVLVDDIDTGAGRRWSLSLHAGVNDPRGDLGRACDGDTSWGVDLEYRFNATWAAELFYGHEDFDCQGADGEIDHLSLNGKAYFLAGPWRPFVGAGVGNYDFSPGPSETGFNLFAGLQANPLPRLGVEGTARYHFVDVSGVEADFLTYHLGLRIRF